MELCGCLAPVGRFLVNLLNCLWKILTCRWGSLRKEPKDDKNNLNEEESLRFWIPQKRVSLQSVASLKEQSLTMSESNFSISETTSIQSEEPEEGPARRHSETSRWYSEPSNEFCKAKRERFATKKAKSFGYISSNYKPNINSIGARHGVGGALLEEGSMQRISEAPRKETKPAEEVLDLGSLLFSVGYDEEEKRLIVRLKQAFNLPMKGCRNGFESLVQLNLVDKKKLTAKESQAVKRQSQILASNGSEKNNYIKSSAMVLPDTLQNPCFHMTFNFKMEKKEDLLENYLRFTVYEVGRQKLQIAVGHLLFDLTEVWKDVERKEHQMHLQPSSIPHPKIGFILVSLCYLTSMQKISVGVLRCRHIHWHSNPKKASFGDVYAKVTLMYIDKKVLSERTDIVSIKENQDAIFNQSFQFGAPPNYLDETSVIITLYLKGKYKRDHVIGRVVSGPFTRTSTKTTHWGRMLLEQRQVTEWRQFFL